MRRLASSSRCCDPPKTPEWVRGKVLFNTADPPMTSRRWIACSSCHPDGHTDGRVWQNPEGLRKTPALFGLAHTHPLHWSADRDEVQDFEYTIRGRLMQGAACSRADQAEGRLRPDRAGRAPGRPVEGPRRPGDLHQLVRVHACRRTSRRRASSRRRPSAARSCSSARRSAAPPATAARTTPTAA